MRVVLGRLAVVAVALALVVVAIEALLRTFAPLHLAGVIGAYQYDPELGTRLKPGIHFLRTTDHQQEVYTNRQGTVNFQDSFQGYRRLVFALGDSYTQGTGLPSDAAYPFQLDLLLNLREGTYVPRYGVVNLGIAALGLEQSILALRRYAKTVGRPGHVLFLGCSNDYEDDQLFEAGYRHAHLVDGNPRFGRALRPLQWLGIETEVGKRAKLAAERLRRPSAVGGAVAGGAGGPAAPAALSVAQLQASRLERLHDEVKGLGATLVVSWTDSPGADRASYDWLKGWAQRRQVAFADWHPLVASVLEHVPRAPITNPHSGGHYRAWVNQMIARAFAEQIRD
jgi:hypothetical protein